MNLCIVSGVVVGKVEYDFLYDMKKNVSIAKFKLRLNSGIILSIYALDSVADKLYAFIKCGDYLLISGKLRTSGEVEAVEVWKQAI